MKTLSPKLSVVSFLAIVMVLTISENRANSQPAPTPPVAQGGQNVAFPFASPSPSPSPSLSHNGNDLRLIVPGINPRTNQFNDLVRVPVVQTEPVRIEGCQTDTSAFFVTGRGGLVPNPYEPLGSSHIWEDLPSPTYSSENYSVAPRASGSVVIAPNRIVEAQNWLINGKGEVVLVADASMAPSQRGCHLH